MRILRELTIGILTVILMMLGKFLALMKDNIIVFFLKFFKSISPRSARDGFDELIEAVNSGPPNSTLLKKMLSNSKYSEVKDVVWGILCFKEFDMEDF